MKITGLEKGYGKQIKVFLEEEYVFSLYSSEINQYNLAVGEELEESLYFEIREDVVFKRGKRKALNLLKRMDYTEGQLRGKLSQGGYPKEMIDRIIDYVAGYHYLDDQRYANNYLQYKKSDKSIRQMKAELEQKGLDSQLVARALKNSGITDEESIKKAIRKKTSNIETLSYEEKRKIAAYLFRKGFSENDIKNQLMF